MKLWKILGLAGLIGGVAATGFVVARRRRAYREVDTAELRDHLRARFDEAQGRVA